MRTVKLLAETAVGGADRWYVSDGATAVGPLALDLIARGIEEGRVPLESYVRHEAWRVWRPVREVAEVRAPIPMDSARPTPPFQPHQMQPQAALSPTDDVTLPGRPLLPEEIAPADALEGAADMSDALHLLLNAAVMHLYADAALLHQVKETSAVVHYAHGPFARCAIGTETALTDPTMMAAQMGHSIVAEPSPGPAGHALIERLLHLGVQCNAATMHPILLGRRLVAVLEVGRKGAQLRASELVILEKLVATFVFRMETGGWH